MSTETSRRRFALAAGAVLAFTVGAGALAAALAAVAALGGEMLPYPDAARLVMIEGSLRENGGPPQAFPISQMDFADWRRRATAFSQMSVFGNLGFNVEQGATSKRVWGELVNDGYFSLLGVQPLLGRWFLPAEDEKPLARYVVVLGSGLWRSSFGGDPAVIGRQVRMNGMAYQVVGVAPPGFHGMSDQAELWVPSMLPPISDYLEVRRERWVAGVGRLAPGVSLREAQRQLDGITAALAHDFPNMDQGMGAKLTPLGESWFGELRQPLRRLALAAAALFLLAVLAGGSLLAARQGGAAPVSGSATGAGGAPYGTGVALALLGALGGLLLAQWAAPALAAASGADLRTFVRLAVTPRDTLLVLLLAAGGGLAAAWLARVVTGRGGGGEASGRTMAAVALLQVALAVTLIGITAHEAVALRRSMNKDLGFRPHGLLTFRIDLKGQQYMDNRFVSRLLRERYLPRIAAVPEVARVALANPTLPSDGLVGGYITIDDHSSAAPDGTYVTQWHSVSPSYFETLGIPILAGRAFDARDTDSDTVIVCKPLADQQWPGKNPLGRHLKQDARQVAKEPWMTVVGVVPKVRNEGIQSEDEPTPDLYMSILRFPLRLPLTINFLIRSRPAVATAQLEAALRQAMMAIDPEIPVYDMKTMDERLEKQTQDGRFRVILATVAAAAVSLFAALGAWGWLGVRSGLRGRKARSRDLL